METEESEKSEPEKEHEESQEQADRLLGEADEMDERTDELEQKVDEVREDFEQKQSGSVPGAQEPLEEVELPDETSREESDQLPEEGPGGQVVDDDEGQGASRDEAEDNPGHPGEDEQATGNPPADD